MNGPTPIMFDMFSAVAWSRPKRRTRSGRLDMSVKCIGSACSTSSRQSSAQLHTAYCLLSQTRTGTVA